MRKKLKDEFPAAGAALLAFEASIKIEQADHHIVYVMSNIYCNTRQGSGKYYVRLPV